MAEAIENPSVMPDESVCRQARLSRDPRFDGRFYFGVLTTGVFCRPVCPARPSEENVRYFPSAAAAQDAGFRPCLRCRPENASGLPEWTLADETVLRGMRLIEAGYLNDHTSIELAAELGISERHLTRLFSQEVGATPASLSRMHRARTARELLLHTSMPLAAVAHHAGYGSLSRFNSEIRKIFSLTPGKLRTAGQPHGAAIELRLTVRQPYDFNWVFAFLLKRSLEGVEEVSGEEGKWTYRRLLERRDGEEAWLEVRQEKEHLVVRIPPVEEPVHRLIHRVRRVFDLNADGATVYAFLSQDEYLGQWVREAPGLRVPGAWDGFETAVRAVLGQQVSVARATLLANHMIERYGGGLFPAPEALSEAEVAELGMPGRRGQAVSTLARMCSDGSLVLDDCQHFDSLSETLQQIDGIGTWTASYIRMRVQKDPDAFAESDWVVLKELDCTPAQARKIASRWQPWRAYALMYLWYAAGVRRAEKRKNDVN